MFVFYVFCIDRETTFTYSQITNTTEYNILDFSECVHLAPFARAYFTYYLIISMEIRFQFNKFNEHTGYFHLLFLPFGFGFARQITLLWTTYSSIKRIEIKHIKNSTIITDTSN